MTVTLSHDQQAAYDSLIEWRASNPTGNQQYLTLGGLAGTGKTTLIARLADEWPNTAVTALSGKAAHVLRSKGVNAQTLHSLIYIPFRTPDGRLVCRRRRFLVDVRTIIVDEASMVDHVTFQDVLAFDRPVLFVGDHGQLPPVGTNPGLMTDPDLRLETIHRQAHGNPILRLAAAFREGREVQLWRDPHGRLSVLQRREFHRLVSPDVQIICGFNRTRHAVNRRVREMLGFDGRLVCPGEKLICLRNNREWRIFNGQQLVVRDIAGEGNSTIDLDVEADDGRIFTLPVLRRQFGCDPIDSFWDQEVALVDYGYCVTAHKAQGSEWPEVLVLEEVARGWDARRWRYTVVTRARERISYCA